MRTFQPDHLLVDYTRTMLASLLLKPRPALIGMIGLGGGSQLKFCHRHLPGARIEVVEVNPDVVALRKAFRIPDDDARLRVIVADGAEFLRGQRGRYDILLVDAYDPSGIPEVLSTQRWYDDCHASLAPGGVMASNLYATDHAVHFQRMQRSFGRDHSLLLEEPSQSNRVAFGWVGAPLPDGPMDVADRVAELPGRVRDTLAQGFGRFAEAWAARTASPGD